MRTTRSITVGLSAALAVMILLGACSRKPDAEKPKLTVGDGGLLSNGTCGPPCFFGIVPGTTRKPTAIQELASAGVYENCEEQAATSSGQAHSIACFALFIVLDPKTEIVSRVSFQPTVKVTVGQILARYGNPAAISVVLIGRPENGTASAAFLYFDSIFMRLALEQQVSERFVVQASTRVVTVDYLESHEYASEYWYVQEWTGYKAYESSGP